MHTKHFYCASYTDLTCLHLRHVPSKHPEFTSLEEEDARFQLRSCKKMSASPQSLKSYINILLMSSTQNQKKLTYYHESEFKSSLHRLPVNLIWKVRKPHISFKVLLLLKQERFRKRVKREACLACILVL